jgi:hypothetical protein
MVQDIAATRCLSTRVSIETSFAGKEVRGEVQEVSLDDGKARHGQLMELKKVALHHS